MPVTFDPEPQASKKRKASKRNGNAHCEPMHSIVEKGVDETPIGKRAKATGGPVTATTADISSAKLQVGAEDGIIEKNRSFAEMDKAKAPAGAGAGANEQHTPLAEDSDIQGNEGEAADSQPGTHMQTRDESTAEGAGVVAETKHSLPPVGKVAPEVPRGRCVSGRVWKTRTQSQRYST